MSATSFMEGIIPAQFVRPVQGFDDVVCGISGENWELASLPRRLLASSDPVASLREADQA